MQPLQEIPQKLLANSLRYFPIERPIYEVGPGLKPLSSAIFERDDLTPYFVQNKLACLQENQKKYVAESALRAEKKEFFRSWLERQIEKEHPGLVDKKRNSLEDLCLLVPEDICLLVKEEERNWLAFGHLCGASHWALQDKIGQDFSFIHAPVPGIERMLRTANTIVDAMIHKGPFVRFVWSFVTDMRINHHPEAPHGVDPLLWKGRSFDLDKPEPFYLRVERQVVYGLPEISASVFTIRLSFWAASEIIADENKKNLLRGAIASMSPESQAYKGVAHCFEPLLQLLR